MEDRELGLDKRVGDFPVLTDEEYAALPVGHAHPSETNSMKYRAAQSLIDQNLYQFTHWLRYRLRDPELDKEFKHSDRLLLKGFFNYVKRMFHNAVCAQTWHMFYSLLEEVSAIARGEKGSLLKLSEKLASPDMKAKLKEAVTIEDEAALDEITAAQVAKAFKKLFAKKVTADAMKEFIEQCRFIRDNLARMGFP